MGQYLCSYAPENPRATKDGYVYTHVLVAENKLNRLLFKDECVHHIDHDKYNNNINNIIVFKTIADHSAFHKGLTAINDGNVYWCPNKGVTSVCPICNINAKDPRASMCGSCWNLYRKKYIHIGSSNQKTKERPSKNLLKQKVRYESFIKIGKEFNVSNNTIKKWCIGYDIPSSRKVINLIPDEEWVSEELSNNTLDLINCYYNVIFPLNENVIIDMYKKDPRLSIVAKYFHTSTKVIKSILIKHSIDILSPSECRFLNIVDMCDKNDVYIRSFLRPWSAAIWLIKNNLQENHNTVKRISYDISKVVDSSKLCCGFFWKRNMKDIHKDYINYSSLDTI